jgi:hypothetical protein
VTDIQDSILKADVILCEMSGKNPNVFYELGLAHAIGKAVILLSHKKSDIPFDLQHVRAILYHPEKDNWEEQLGREITAVAQKMATSDKIWPPPLIREKILSLPHVIIVSILLLTSFLAVYLTRSSLQREHIILLERSYKEIAKQVKSRFEEKFMNNTSDDKLNVSYWFNRGGTLYQLATTEDRSPRGTFTKNKTSIIGCAFVYPNHFVERDNKAQPPIITSYNREPSPDGNTCQYLTEGRREIKYIACSSYNGTTNPDANPDFTVGICVFTENDNDILKYNFHDFLRERTAEFYESVRPLIEDKKLAPQ